MNGLRTFSMHQNDSVGPSGIEPLVNLLGTENKLDLLKLDKESAARRYVNAALADPALENFEAVNVNGAYPEFKCLGVERIPFTNTETVKFRQFYRKIPVYGSIITVELNDQNELVSLNSSIGEPININPHAKVSPKRALNIAQKNAGYGDDDLDATPRLNYYFDRSTSRWRLVYIVEDVEVRTPTSNKKKTFGELPEYCDYIIDADSGKILRKLARTQTMGRIPIIESANDGLGAVRNFGAINDSDRKTKEMEDTSRNIHTHNFDFRDVFFQRSSLPGNYASNPPVPWPPEAVSAHANSAEVANFLLNVLERDGLDGLGGAIVSSVNCVYNNTSGEKEWRNAARIPGQMIYGQRLIGDALVSYAVAKDVVAHELLHGLTDHTARLVYEFESGALNESYSDIFGIIVSNLGTHSVDDWDWEMGEELSESGMPLRDMADPTRHGQPAHMNDYVNTTSDHGGVHINSGIHNKAAYNILTSKNEDGEFEFDPVTVARLFYLTLSQDLSRTSGFLDSRRGLEKWTKSLFRNKMNWQHKVNVIAQAFLNVGIRDDVT